MSLLVDSWDTLTTHRVEQHLLSTRDPETKQERLFLNHTLASYTFIPCEGGRPQISSDTLAKHLGIWLADVGMLTLDMAC